MNQKELFNKIREDRFPAIKFSKVLPELTDDMLGFIIEQSNVVSAENFIFRHIFDTPSHQFAAQIAVGGDWEGPAELLLYIDVEGDVWLHFLFRGQEQYDASSYPSFNSSALERKVKMMRESPVMERCECVGNVKAYFE